MLACSGYYNLDLSL